MAKKKKNNKSNKMAVESFGKQVIQNHLDASMAPLIEKWQEATKMSFKNILAKGAIILEIYTYFIKHNFSIAAWEEWCRANLGLAAGQAHMWRRIPIIWGVMKNGILVPILPAKLIPLVDPEAMLNIAKKKTNHECRIWRNAYRRLLEKSLDNEYYPGGSVVPWAALKWGRWGESRRAKTKQSRRVFCDTSVDGVLIRIDVSNEDGLLPSKSEALKRAKEALKNCELTAED